MKCPFCTLPASTAIARKYTQVGYRARAAGRNVLRWGAMLVRVLTLVLLQSLAATHASATTLALTQDPQLPAAWREAIEGVLRQRLLAATDAQTVTRLSIHLGAPDVRLRLAPCGRVQAQLPPSQRLNSNARVGVRCIDGSARWATYIPLQLSWHGPAWVSTGARPAGHVLGPADLAPAEVQLNAQTSPAITDRERLVGRTLARPVGPGQTLSEDSLQARQWFTAGEIVQVRAQGAGLTVSTVGEALTRGMEGQPARVRVDGGKVITGHAAGERLVLLRW